MTSITGGRAYRPRWTAVLVDLDGTLIDTRPGIRAAIAAALRDVTGDASGGERADLSLPLEEMIASAEPTAPPSVRQGLAAAFREDYDAGSWEAAILCPGARDCVRDLHAAGLRLFVITNKRSSAALRLLEHFDLARHLERVVGQPEAGTPLPKSELAGRCLAEAGLDPAATVVVGDSDQDAAMAAAWRLTFVAVTSGTGPLGHAAQDEERVEVESLAGVTAFVLGDPPGGHREP